MKIRPSWKIEYDSWVLPVLINSILLLAYCVFAHPRFHTEEAVYVMYMMAGAFGASPSELTHLNFYAHPWLTSLLSRLYTAIPGYNWLIFAILLTCWISGVVTLKILMKRLQRPITILLYIACTIVFIGPLFLKLGITEGALLPTMAALFLLVDAYLYESVPVKQYLAALLLLLLASLFRIHVMIPFAGLLLPLLLVKRSFPAARRPVSVLILTGLLIFSAVLFQQSYYGAKIPHWNREEAYRQKIYEIYNDQRYDSYASGPLQTEFAILRNGLPADTGFLSTEKLVGMKAALDADRFTVVAPGKSQLYWFLVNNRIYFTAIIIVVSICLLFGLPVRFLLPLFLLTTAGFLTLEYWKQLPRYLFRSVIYFDLLLCVMVTVYLNPKRIRNIPAYYAALLFLSFWGIVRLYKTGEKHHVQSSRFLAYYTYIRQHPNQLFISVGDAFPLSYAPLFSDPRTYALPNYLDSDHFLQRIADPVLARFKLKNFREIPHSPNVYFLGNCFPELLQYFKTVNGQVPVVRTIPQRNSEPPLFQLQQP